MEVNKEMDRKMEKERSARERNASVRQTLGGPWIERRAKRERQSRRRLCVLDSLRRSGPIPAVPYAPRELAATGKANENKNVSVDAGVTPTIARVSPSAHSPEFIQPNTTPERKDAAGQDSYRG